MGLLYIAVSILILFIVLYRTLCTNQPDTLDIQKVCKQLILQDKKVAGLIVLLSYTSEKNQRLVLRIRQTVRRKFPHSSTHTINQITCQLLVYSANISLNRNKK